MDPETLAQDAVTAVEVTTAVAPGSVLFAIVLVVLGIVLGRLAGRALESTLSDPLGSHRTLILRRITAYGIFALFSVSALHQLGIELSVLLGAAGILTVALGFASQTAASNVVSGLFLLGERPFEVGETIRLADTTGEVLSIDLLSIQLRTFDNLLVRVPNESVMKSAVTNFTRFPIRRFDLKLFVDPNVDLDDLDAVLLSAARAPLVLAEPEPIVILLGFTESGLEVQLSAWTLRENFLEMRNGLHRDAVRALRDAHIPLGFPNRVVSQRPSGSATAIRSKTHRDDTQVASNPEVTA